MFAHISVAQADLLQARGAWLPMLTVNSGFSNSSNERFDQASTVRLRPILMTTFTTLFGMLPLALGIGEGSELNRAGERLQTWLTGSRPAIPVAREIPVAGD